MQVDGVGGRVARHAVVAPRFRVDSGRRRDGGPGLGRGVVRPEGAGFVDWSHGFAAAAGEEIEFPIERGRGAAYAG